MSFIFSPKNKYQTWRKLWIALAEAEKTLGIDISSNQITEMKSKASEIDFSLVSKYESQIHHDVMAHIHAYSDQCPKAKGIIHLGATSCYVTDNTDLIQIKEALTLLLPKLVELIRELTNFSKHYKNLPCLAFTHFQPAQPTTLGKRSSLWLQDILMDLKELDILIEALPFLGAKGASGTQASFINLFENDSQKVKDLDKILTKKLGFKHFLTISSQTYPRKIDIRVLNLLNAISVSAHKFAVDLRLLSHLKEVEEPMKEKQVGSSAMPHKQNPIKSERICSLARFVMNLVQNASQTAANQWLERTLDDSANRRLVIPEAFLATDAILNLFLFIIKDLTVNQPIIEANLQKELPFLALENILLDQVKKGGDRQVVHEKLREHSKNAITAMKKLGKSNDLIDRIKNDPEIQFVDNDLDRLLNPLNFIGRCTEQVEEFIQYEVRPILEKYETVSHSQEEISL